MTTHPPEIEMQTLQGNVNWSYTPLDGDTSTASFTNYSTFQKSYRYRAGDNSPDWPRVKSINSYQHNFTEVHRELVNFKARNDHLGSALEVYSGNVGHPNLTDPSSDGGYLPQLQAGLDRNREQLVRKLLSRLSQGKVNAAQFIAEREQTKNLVASTARRIASAAVNLRRGNVKAAIVSLTGTNRYFKPGMVYHRGPGRVAGGLPEQWLALQYGWKPLLSDIYGSCEELARFATGVEPDAASVSASVKTSLDRKDYDSGGDNGWFPPASWRQTQGEIHGSGSIYYKIGSPLINALSRTGVVNPVTLAWELLPWSFVVDWFYPVGDFLEQCNAEDGLLFSKGWLVQKTSAAWSAKLKANQVFSGGYDVKLSGGNHTARVSSYKRSALTGFPIPSWPSFKDPFSSTHVANGLSLLATAFGRGPRVR